MLIELSAKRVASNAFRERESFEVRRATRFKACHFKFGQTGKFRSSNFRQICLSSLYRPMFYSWLKPSVGTAFSQILKDFAMKSLVTR